MGAKLPRQSLNHRPHKELKSMQKWNDLSVDGAMYCTNSSILKTHHNIVKTRASIHHSGYMYYVPAGYLRYLHTETSQLAHAAVG